MSEAVGGTEAWTGEFADGGTSTGATYCIGGRGASKIATRDIAAGDGRGLVAPTECTGVGMALVVGIGTRDTTRRRTDGQLEEEGQEDK